MNNKLEAWIGIDPGKTGCACLLTDEKELFFFDWPKSNSVYEVHSVIRNWRIEYHIMGCALERVHSMPGQGVKSMFTFGENYGRWQGLLACHRLPFLNPTPQQWQKGMVKKSDGPDTKTRSYIAACRLWPNAEFTGPRGGIKDGRADAALMAYWVRKEIL